MVLTYDECISEYKRCNFVLLELPPAGKPPDETGKFPKTRDWRKTPPHFPEDPTKNVGVVLGKIAANLHSLDFDGKDLAKEIEDLPDLPKVLQHLFCSPWRMQTSPGHQQILFYTSEEQSKITIPITKHVDRCYRREIIEILGEGQQTVLPPSQCSKWEKDSTPVYEKFERFWLGDITSAFPITITTEEWHTIIDYLTEIYSGKKERPKSLLLKPKGCRPSSPTAMRRPFQDILEGKYIISHAFDPKTGEPEFKYWEAFWREAYNCGVDFSTAFIRLADSQPEFDEIETDRQLAYREIMDSWEKRPSTALVNRLFPDYASSGESSDLDIAEISASITENAPMIYHINFKQWCHYNGLNYTMNTLDCRQIIRKALKEQQIPPRYIPQILDEIMDNQHFTMDQFDCNPHILVMSDAIWDESIHSTHEKGDPTYLSVYRSPIKYNPKQTTRPTEYAKFVENQYPGDLLEQLRHDYIHREILLCQLHRRKKFLVIHGVPNSGKSIMNNLHCRWAGAGAYAETSINKLDDTFKTGTQLGIRFLFTADGSKQQMKTEALARSKKMTGNDFIGYEKKGIDEFFARVTFDLVLTVNDMPYFPRGEKFTAFTDRAIFQILTKSYPQDNAMEDRLYAECDAIASYLLNLVPASYPCMPYSETRTPSQYWLDEAYPVKTWLKNNIEARPDHLKIYADTGMDDSIRSLLDEIYEAIQTSDECSEMDIDIKDLRKDVIPFIRRMGGKVVEHKVKGEGTQKFYWGVALKSKKPTKPKSSPKPIKEDKKPCSPTEIEEWAKDYGG